MSWSTIVNNDSSIVANNRQLYLSEEAILHSLRCTYQTAMDNLSKSDFIGDDKWRLGKTILEELSNKALSYLEKIPNVQEDLLEISYLSNRNRIDCLSKEESSNPEVCYQLCLDLVFRMLDLHKHDSLLLLKTAEYALKVNDLWTYKQLTLIDNASVPYMYSNIILKKFNANMEQHRYNICNNYIDDPNLNNLNLNQNKENILLNMKFNDSDQFFLSFTKKLLQHEDVSYNWLVENTNVANTILDTKSNDGMKRAAIVDVDEDVHREDTLLECRDILECNDILQSDDIHMRNQETILLVSNLSLTAAAEVVEEDIVLTVGKHVSMEITQEQQEQQQQKVEQQEVQEQQPSRRSSRRKDQTEQQLTLANNISESSVSGTHNNGGIATAIKELLHKHINFDCYYHQKLRIEETTTNNTTSALVLFSYIFVLPFDCISVSTSTTLSHHDSNSGTNFNTNIETTTTNNNKSSNNNNNNNDNNNNKSKTYSEYKICELFQVLKQYSLISSQDPCKICLLSNLYIHFIDILAHQEYNERCDETFNNSKDLYNLDILVLICWNFVQENTIYNRNQLFENLDEYEVLFLAECCLSIIKKHKQNNINNYDTFNPNFYSIVCETFFRLLNIILTKQYTLLNVDSNNYHQIRFLWLLFWGSNESLIQLEHYSLSLNNHYELLDMIKSLLIKIDVLRIVIPYLVDVSCNVIDAKVCDELLASYKYKELITCVLNRYKLCKAWIKEEALYHMNVENIMFFCSFPINLKEYSHINGIDILTNRWVVGTTITLPILILDICSSSSNLLCPVLWWESLAIIISTFQTGFIHNHNNNSSRSSNTTMSTSNINIYDSLLKDVLKKMIPIKIAIDLNDHQLLFIQSNIMSVLHKMTFFLNMFTYTSISLPSEHIINESIIKTSVEIFSFVIEDFKECFSINNAIKLISINAVHPIMHILVSTSMNQHSSTTSVSLLLCLWKFFCKIILESYLDISSLPLSIIELLIVVSMQVLHLENDNNELRIALLYVLLSCVAHYPKLSTHEKSNIYQQCYLEITSQDSYDSDGIALNIIELIAKQLELLLYNESDWSLLLLFEQKALCYLLGKLYYCLYDFPMVPSVEENLKAITVKVKQQQQQQQQQQQENEVAIMYKLYLYAKFCIKTGFFGKSELRCSLLMIARSKKFEQQAYSTTTSLSIIRYFFEDCSALSDFNPQHFMCSLESESNHTKELDEDKCVDTTMINEIATDLFESILLLGITTTTVTASFEEVKRLRPQPDILSNYASWGPLYIDQGNLILIDICLKDLAYNPFRYTTWMLLRMRLIHSLNDTLDEMQKLFLINQIPSYCYDIIIPDTMCNLHPVKKVFDASDIDVQQQILSEFRNTVYNKVEQVLQHATHSQQQQQQQHVEKFQNKQIFESSCAYQTFLNLNHLISSSNSNSSSDDNNQEELLLLNSDCYHQYLQALIHLILLRNSLLLLLQRISVFVEYSVTLHKLLIVDYSLFHSTEIASSLLLYNVSNCFPIKSQTRSDISKVIIGHLSKDDFLSNDIYALTMCAKLSWQNIDIASTTTTTTDVNCDMNISNQRSYHVVLQLCIKLANIIVSPLNKSSSLKSIKKSAFYQIYSICSKASLMIIQVIYDRKYDNNSDKGYILTLITLVEECYFILKTNFLFKKYMYIDNIEEQINMSREDRFYFLHNNNNNDDNNNSSSSSSSSSSSNDIMLNDILHRSWFAVLYAIIGLKECRRIENYDFKSIYRITDILQLLSNMKMQYNNNNENIIIIPDWLELLCNEPILLGSSNTNNNSNNNNNSSSSSSSSSSISTGISIQSSLEEMSKLFNRKVPQIISLWSTENNPINPWDKMLHRVSYFDNIRSLYTVKYLNLAKDCNELEVVFDVLSYSIAAINDCCHSVVFHIINKSIETLYDIISNLLQYNTSNNNNDQPQDLLLLTHMMKSNSLKGNADHTLQLIYEVYHKLIFSTKILIEIPIQNKLKYSIYILFPYSQLYKQHQQQLTDQVISLQQSTAPSAVVVDMTSVLSHLSKSCTNSDNTSIGNNNNDINISNFQGHVFGLILTICKNKWNKLNRTTTELGKRSRSYFVNIQNNNSIASRSMNHNNTINNNNDNNNNDDDNDINNNNDGDNNCDSILESNVSDVEHVLSSNNNLESTVVVNTQNKHILVHKDLETMPSKFARIDILDSVLSLIMK